MKPEEAYRWLYVHFAPCGDETKQDEAVNVALKALEKQIPKKPVMDYQFPEKLRKVIERTNIELAKSKTECCPVCGRPLGISQFVKTQTGQKFGDPHCKRCGQRIEWEGKG
jgi:DNA repair exonuclease SbcCD ATPase subunit